MITILPETTKDPISLIGRRAGICWGADITDKKKNYKRGLECILNNHGRTWEFVNIEMIIEGYSARVIREWYTHIGGSPTRLQSSTRYVNYDNFDYYTPASIKKDNELLYNEAMTKIMNVYKELEENGVPKEDIANLLPLGMTTKIVDKRNLRSLADMSKQRMCTRALAEYRELFNEIEDKLFEVSNEWKELIDSIGIFHPKCCDLRYCPEKYSCGMFPRKSNNNERK